MTRPPAPWPDHLGMARLMVARRAVRPPVQLADQIDAAARDTRVLHARLGQVLPIMQPDRRWQHRADVEPTDEVRAYLLAAMLGCTTVCPHLRRGGPRPGIARLALTRIDCERCSRTIHRPPAGTDDRCDVCWKPETLVFHPFAVRLGPLMLAGDACTDCADVMGIRMETAS